MAKTRESKLDYIKEYNRTRTRVISFRLNNENDAVYCHEEFQFFVKQNSN